MNLLLIIENVTRSLFDERNREKRINITEQRASGKKINVVTELLLDSENNFNIFDFAVFSAVLSLSSTSTNNVIAIKSISRFLGFSINNKNGDVEVVASLKKMAGTNIKIRSPALDKVKKGKLQAYSAVPLLTGKILPAVILSMKLRGQDSQVIRILDESPLLKFAKIKKQIVMIDGAVINPKLKIPNFRLTPQIIKIVFYVVWRIAQWNGKLKKVILLDTLCKSCAYDFEKKYKRQDLKKTLKILGESLKLQGFVALFEVDGRKIIFDFSP